MYAGGLSSHTTHTETHPHGDSVPRPTPRHRRRAGSGPPAAALIAWIGTDARRYGTANSVREPELRPPASTRPARNTAASVALVCGAVLAVTASATEGILGPSDATTAPVIPQAGPDQAAPPVPAKQVDQDMVVSPVPVPVPVAALPALVRQAPKSIPVPPATEQVAEAAAPVAAPPAAAKPVPPVTAPRAAAPRVTTQPDASAQRHITSKPDDTRTSPADRTAHSGQQSTSGRGSRSGGLGPTLNRTTGSLGSALGLR